MTEIEFFVNQNMIASGLNSPEAFIREHDLRSHLRNTDLVLLRYEIMYRLVENKHTSLLSLVQIGKMFDKNHSTVIHAHKEVIKLREIKDALYLKMLEKYEEEINTIKF